MLSALWNAIPTPVKVFVAVLFALQPRSWPLYWHLRMAYPLVVPLSRYMLQSGSRKKRMEVLRAGSASPFEAQTVWRGWAGFDDCDYNMHLSNSSYAKNFDYARSEFIARYLLAFGFDGGLPAVSHVQFRFIREVPFGRWYEIRTSIAGWDDKRIHFLARVVSRSNGSNRTSEVPFAQQEPGWTTHAIGIATYVCKHASSRRTIPPALVLAAAGFGPGWARVQELRDDPREAKKFWAGGWADYEGECWWDTAALEWEPQRALAAVDLLKMGA